MSRHAFLGRLSTRAIKPPNSTMESAWPASPFGDHYPVVRSFALILLG